MAIHDAHDDEPANADPPPPDRTRSLASRYLRRLAAPGGSHPKSSEIRAALLMAGAADTDGSGGVTAAECDALLARIGADDHGRVSLDDLGAAIGLRPIDERHRARRERALVDAFDADRDGAVTISDLLVLLARWEPYRADPGAGPRGRHRPGAARHPATRRMRSPGPEPRGRREQEDRPLEPGSVPRRSGG